MAADQKRIKFLGKMAEANLRKLCVAENLSASRPDDDTNGWDFLVEFPPNSLPNVYMDAQPSSLKCLIQVKGTDDFADFKLNMKVSNFRHLATTPMPTFIFVQEFKGQSDPQATYLCHFGQKLIGQTLRRVRQLQVAGHTALNRHSMTLNVEEADQLDLCASDPLSRSIVGHSTRDLGAYVTRKSEIVRTVGFEDGAYKLHFKSDEPKSRFIDASLGIVDLDVSELVILSSRFGIDIPERRLGVGKITMSPSARGPCKVAIVSPTRADRATIDASVYTSALSAFTEEIAFKVSNDNVTLYVYEHGGRVKFDYGAEAPQSLNRAITNIAFMLICCEAGAKARVLVKGRELCTLTIDNLTPSDSVYPLALRRLRALRALLDKGGFRDDLVVDVKRFLSQDSEFNWAGLALSPKRTKISQLFESEQYVVVGDEKGIVASVILFDVGDSFCAIFCFWKAVFTFEPKTVRSEIRQCRIWDVLTFEKGDRAAFVSLVEDFKAHCAKLGKGPVLWRTITIAENDAAESEPA